MKCSESGLRGCVPRLAVLSMVAILLGAISAGAASKKADEEAGPSLNIALLFLLKPVPSS